MQFDLVQTIHVGYMCEFPQFIQRSQPVLWANLPALWFAVNSPWWLSSHESWVAGVAGMH